MWFMVHGSQAKPTYSAVFRSVSRKQVACRMFTKMQLSKSKNKLINTGWIIDICRQGSVEEPPAVTATNNRRLVPLETTQSNCILDNFITEQN